LSPNGQDPHFAIALSFPGEHRQFVQKVALRLAESGKLTRDLVFYDQWHQTKILGMNAQQNLMTIYGKQSDLIVPFFSEFYTKKWCGIEWDAIRVLLLDRARQNNVLPVHLDGTKIAGWPETGLGIRRGRMTAAKVADLILEKYLDRQWRAAPTPAEQQSLPSIFISHHSHDVTLARQMKSHLAKLAGSKGARLCAPWLAADDIEPGDEYRQSIDDALRAARAVVLILSPESCSSMFVTYEWAYALGRGIPVIPVLLRPGGKIHPRLEVLQYLSFEKHSDQPWDRLMAIVSRKIMASKAMAINPVEIEMLKDEVRSEIAKKGAVGHAIAKASAHAPKVDTLLVIDVQRDFFLHGALPVPEAESLIGPLNKAIAAAHAAGMRVLFSRDWHPSNHKSFVNMSPSGTWPRHCVQNTIGAEFHPKLKIPAGSEIIDIGANNSRLGYSAFEDHKLNRLMERPDSGTLYIAGIALEYCVHATALEAVGRYKKPVVILERLVRATTTNRRELTPLWNELKNEGVERHAGPVPFLSHVK
jgi:nicotinamidase/pyrazinamidase